ncbi:ABC transporter ATP-binding protein [uncultured Brevibacillus sp.]|uniref:ABC transporter ATP-binding protein n=1 Tax=uncultured Brevibacillus sp. TaxID=169970 RepID=UPI00259771CB|nr:ABC transporter ATP-binding protein [uncultured Brevibacillus sp.]
MITLQNVQFEYQSGKPLLQDIDLHIKRGECVCITGPSGSGKTTLGRILNGLIPHFYEGHVTGDITIDGQSTQSLPIWEWSKKIGSVFQDPKSQFFTSIVQDELAFELENYGIERPIIRQRLEEVITQKNLQAIRHQNVMSLSSGQKQKVAIAATQLIEPPIFVMDEPSANLDLSSTQILHDELVALKRQGKTIVVVEHRLYYLMDIVDRIIYMENGRITKMFTPDELQNMSSYAIRQLGLRSPSLQTGEVNRWSLPEPEPKILIEKLTVRHPRAKDFVLQNVNLTLRTHEVTALIGKNGAGKTTLARTLIGLTKEKSGKIFLDGRPLNGKQRMKDIWFVMQDTVYQLFTDSVWNELLLHQKGSEDVASRLLRELDLWHLKDHHPATLSGGEKQRLVLAIGLMHKASIFILDEPTSGLDGMNLQRVINIIHQLVKPSCHVLVITHDHELVAGACQRIIQLENGKITKDLATNELSYQDIFRLLEQVER